MRTALFSLCAVASFAGALALPASAAVGAGDAAPPASTLLRLDPGVQRDGRLRFHAARVDSDALARASLPGGLLVLPNPAGGQLSYEYLSHTTHASGDVTWVGRAEGAPFGREAVITLGPGAAFGRLPLPDGSVVQLETIGGQVRLMVDEGIATGRPSHVQTDDAMVPPLEELRAARSRQAATAPVQRPHADAAQVDVMLAYSSGLADYVGGDAAVRTLLQNRIDIGNQALGNAGVHGRFRLVATPRVDFPDTGSNSGVLEGITRWRDYYDFNSGFSAPPLAVQLVTLRHRHGADIVGLVRRFLDDESVSCGNGWLGGYNQTPIANLPAAGYFTASHGSDGGLFCGDHVIAHEIGHNLGQDHDIDNSNGRFGAHTYSHGYRASPPGKAGFFTMMAYGLEDMALALTYSNPDVTRADCADEACGLVDANVAASLNLTMPDVAAWLKPADGADRDIAGTSGHLLLDLAGLPALTNARWRAEFTGPGHIHVTGPTVAAAGEPLQARLAWDALPGTPTAPLAVRVVVESSPGVFAAERQLTLTRREWLGAARVLAEGVPTTVAVAGWNRNVEEGRMYVPVPPHARNLRISVSSGEPVAVHATRIFAFSPDFYPRMGTAPGRDYAEVYDSGPSLVKQLDFAITPSDLDSRIVVSLARPHSTTLDYQAATITASFTGHDPAPAFQSGQYFNPERSGHGVFVDFSDEQWVAVWYTYFEDGTPTWYYAEAPAPVGNGPGIWSAPMFRVGWDGSQTHSTQVGRMVVTPMDPTTMVFSYNLDGDSGTERLVRLGGAGCPTSQGAPLDATGHWFSPGLNGFGYSAQFEPDQEIYTTYLYDAAGVARWLIGAKPWNEAVTQLGLEQITGSCPTCGYAATRSVATGQLTRTLGENGDGKRGLTHLAVVAPLLAPLAGEWSQSWATALLSKRKECF